MRAIYYNELRSELEAVSGINKVERWVNQIALGNKLTGLPAVFIEIAPINYNSATRLQQNADNVNVILHLIVKKYTTEDTEDSLLYDLSQAIYKKLQVHPNFERIAEALDVTSDDNLEDFQLTYVISRLLDQDAVPTTQLEPRPDPNFNESLE